ncbi:MAG TPA: rRNA maturation RNase YbeY [Actinomycetota bacterium]|nr:rRNA maturation RNase YbeY [Actinomycetota bacterium]
MGVDMGRILDVAVRTAESEGASGEISITLVTPERMAELNAEHMGKPGATDVLSFPIDGLRPPAGPSGSHIHPGDGPPWLIGEVVLCPEVAAQQATAGVEEELDLLVAHGVLHLLGYDHETESGAQQMRIREHHLTGRSGAQA